MVRGALGDKPDGGHVAKKQAEPESKFAPGQMVRFTDEGLKRYRSGPREEMAWLRSRDVLEGYVPSGTVMALVRYSDGSEAVYEEAYLEAV
jgi:hypothetical protein